MKAHPNPREHHCANPRCREPIYSRRHRLCPSCRYIGRWGMAAGGFVCGVIVALAKLFLK